MNNSNEQKLGDVLKQFINSFRLNDHLNEVKLNGLWENIIGKTNAKHTTNLSLRNRILYVSMDSAALKQELYYAKDKILKNINKYLGEKLIDDIFFS